MSINCGGDLIISSNGNLNINYFSNILGIQFGTSTGNSSNSNNSVSFIKSFPTGYNYVVFMSPGYSPDYTYAHEVGITNSPNIVSVSNSGFTWTPNYVYSYTGNGQTYIAMGSYTIYYLAICYG
jgi:hypothetical protein